MCERPAEDTVERRAVAGHGPTGHLLDKPNDACGDGPSIDPLPSFRALWEHRQLSKVKRSFNGQAQAIQ